MRNWQLPGGLGRDDARRAEAESVRTDPRRRRAAVLLAGRAWQISHALFGWPVRRQLVDGVCQRSWRRQIRRCMAGAEFLKIKIRPIRIGPNSKISIQKSTLRRRGTWVSSAGGVVTSI